MSILAKIYFPDHKVLPDNELIRRDQSAIEFHQPFR